MSLVNSQVNDRLCLFSVFREEVEQREQLKKMAAGGSSPADGAADAKAQDGAASASSGLTAQSEADALAVSDAVALQLQQAAAAGAGGGAGGRAQVTMRVVRGVSAREVWLQTAELLVSAGRLRVAKALLGEARRHCLAYDDAEGLAAQRHLSSRVAALEGQPEQALKLEFSAQLYAGDAAFWRAGVEWLVECLQRTSRYSHFAHASLLLKQTSVLKKSIATFEQLAADPDAASSAVESKRTAALLERTMAGVLVCDSD